MKEQQVHVLRYAVRGRVVCKYLGNLFLGLAALETVPLAVSFIAGEYAFGARYAAAFAVFALPGALMSRIRASVDIQSNESLTVAGLAFAITPAVLSFPMMAGGLSFLDALFESVSGITTTGLSTLAAVHDEPEAFLFARSWMQWTGGLGIVVLTLALLMRPGTSAKRLAYTEAEKTDMLSGTRAHAQRMLKVYLALTALGVVLLWAIGVDFFTAVIHTLSAVSTGGFSSFDDSLQGIGGFGVQAAVILISFSGAVPLALYYKAFLGRTARGLLGDAEVRALFVAALTVTCLLALSMAFAGHRPPGEIIRDAPLMAFSAQTTTGFSTVRVSGLEPASKLILIVSMITGGSVGSTAGGMKILRLLILLKMVRLTVLKTCLPQRAVVEPRIEGQRLEDEEIQRALVIILLFGLVVVVSWVFFVAAGHDPLDSLFDVVSAVGTVGLSTGVTSAGLEPLLKGVLCVDMLFGRLEIVAFLVILYPGNWFGRRVGQK